MFIDTRGRLVLLNFLVMWTMHELLQNCSTFLGNVNAERGYVEEKVMYTIHALLLV